MPPQAKSTSGSCSPLDRSTFIDSFFPRGGVCKPRRICESRRANSMLGCPAPAASARGSEYCPSGPPQRPQHPRKHQGESAIPLRPRPGHTAGPDPQHPSSTEARAPRVHLRLAVVVTSVQPDRPATPLGKSVRAPSGSNHVNPARKPQRLSTSSPSSPASPSEFAGCTYTAGAVTSEPRDRSSRHFTGCTHTAGAVTSEPWAVPPEGLDQLSRAIC